MSWGWPISIVMDTIHAVGVCTIPIAMLRVLGADFGTDWGLFAAAGAIYLAPVLLVAFFLQNQLLRGATFGTVTR